MAKELSIGERIADRYDLTAFLGRGGFASVWRARDRQLGREVAIKALNLEHVMLGSDGANAGSVLQRFEREARLAASLHHPNVVQIHDIGHIEENARRPYIVMELLAGQDLKEHIDREGPMSPERLLPLFVACLDGLDRAHQLGIVHKDLKPSNLFLHEPGRRTETLKVVDFGIAHISQPSSPDSERLTSTGQILGTPQYLPPEYIHRQEVSAAMDVYQMTLILIEALTAEYVVGSNNSLQCLIIHGDGRLEIPRYLLESELGPLIRRGLSREVAERYRDAGELAEALSQLDPRRIPPRPDTRGVPLERVRLDGGGEVSQRIAMAPSLLMESGALERGEVPSGHRPETPAAPSSWPGAPRAEAMAPRPQPRQDEASKATAHAAPRPTVKHASGLSFGWMVVLLCGLAMLAVCGLCMLGMLVEEDQQSEAFYGAQAPATTVAPEGEAEPEIDEETQALMDEITQGGEIAELLALDAPQEDTPQEEDAAEAEAVRTQVMEAQQLLEGEEREAASALCERLIDEVAGKTFEILPCYNVVMRAAWNPTRPFDARCERACKLLFGYMEAYPEHEVSIGVQRKIMKCLEHDV